MDGCALRSMGEPSLRYGMVGGSVGGLQGLVIIESKGLRT